ncbi:MAG TPA: adenylate/guanylate cyclase domain-containing protein [Anaerolineae bacterium]|nr:adenylate/guanylate cyclase domain-containing protein [Anaerolineae bacterium]
MPTRAELEQSITALEAQRAILGDIVVDAALLGLRQQLAALDTPPPTTATRQRKQITVLFADISGFTAMSEQLDAEDVTDIMNHLWTQIDDIIIQHGGFIDKHIGDAVMALWGVDQTRESDPEQAIRAALGMQAFLQTSASTKSWPSRLKQTDIPQLAMRIGINTGPVVLSHVGNSDEYTAVGDTVNTASRLEHAAPITGILIAHTTYRQVRGLFDVAPQPPLTVKGKSEPLQSYLILKAKPRAFHIGNRGLEGINTRMIGRDDEFQQLKHAYHNAHTKQQTTLITIIGEAGLGKSRLLHEFEKWLELQPEEVWYFSGRAYQQSSSNPYYLLRDMFARRFQILETDNQTVVADKMTSSISKILSQDGEMKAHILGKLLGYQFKDSPYLSQFEQNPELLLNYGLLYLSQLFTTLSETKPVVILLEDIHWADQPSLDAIEDFWRRAPHLPLFSLSLARPQLSDIRPSWLTNHQTIALSPLTTSTHRQLIAEILQKVPEVPSKLEQTLLERTEGNPFYLEELVKVLIDNKIIITHFETWHIDMNHWTDNLIPPSLTGILQSRIERLTSSQQTILQQAAVIGRTFWNTAIYHLHDQPEQVILALDDLHQKEIIFPRKSTTFSNTIEYTFKHILLRDISYETILKQQRRQYHQQTAIWLEQVCQANNRLDTYAPHIAYHYYQAGESDSAAHWYQYAAEQAANRHAHKEAIHHFNLAYESTDPSNVVGKYQLLLHREQSHKIIGNRESQLNDLEELQKLATQLSTLDQTNVYLRLAQYAISIDDYHQTITYAQTTIELAQQISNISLEANGYLIWGYALIYLSDYPAAQTQLKHSLALSQQTNQPIIKIKSLHYLGIIARKLGHYSQAESYYQQAHHIYSIHPNLPDESSILNALGHIAIDQSQFQKAELYYKKSLTIRENNNDRLGQSYSLTSLGVISCRYGNFTQGQKYYQQALSIANAIDNQYIKSICLNNLGQTLIDMQDYEPAQKYLEQALAITKKTGNRHSEGVRYTSLGKLALNKGNLNQAQYYYQQAITITKQLNQLHHEISCQAALALIAVKTDNLDEAKIKIDTAITYLQENQELNSLTSPYEFLLTCIQVLLATNKTQALTMLKQAYDRLQTEANQIDTIYRTIFLTNIPEHRQINNLYQKYIATSLPN